MQAALRKRVNLRHLSIYVPKQMSQRGRNRHPARVSVSPSDHGKIFCQRKKFFVNTCNNQIARSKAALFGKRTLVGAVGYVLALPQSGNARVCAPLLLFPKISQCVSTLRFSGTRLIINCAFQSRAFRNAHSRRSSRLRSRIAAKRQCSRVRSAPPLPKNLAVRKHAAIFGNTFNNQPRFSVSALNLPKTFGF